MDLNASVRHWASEAQEAGQRFAPTWQQQSTVVYLNI